MITRSEVLAIMHTASGRVDQFLEPLNTTCDEFHIDTPDRQAAFLAELAHESRELGQVSEGMNYSADRLTVIWPSRFPTLADAFMFAHQPERLANHVYANRNGNGDEDSGDGWRFRGAGGIQLTFRNSHEACAKYFGIPLDEVGAWLRTPEGACRSAGWFWWTNALNLLADTGQFKLLTRRINPGLVGLAERTIYWERAKGVLA